MADRKLAGTITVEVATLADEFVWILEDTAAFIAGRAVAAIERYVQGLLPPFAAALARYDREREYSWAAPGHQGGVAFLKSPVGRAFFDFYGENLFRTDMGIERGRARLAAGPQRPDRRERAIRRAGVRRPPLLLGAERHLGVRTARSCRPASATTEIALCDRNCHKSIEQGLVHHRRHPGVPEPHPQSLRHHRADPAGAARARGDREGDRRTTRWRSRPPASARCTRW